MKVLLRLHAVWAKPLVRLNGAQCALFVREYELPFVPPVGLVIYFREPDGWDGAKHDPLLWGTVEKLSWYEDEGVLCVDLENVGMGDGSDADEDFAWFASQGWRPEG